MLGGISCRNWVINYESYFMTGTAYILSLIHLIVMTTLHYFFSRKFWRKNKSSPLIVIKKIEEVCEGRENYRRLFTGKKKIIKEKTLQGQG